MHAHALTMFAACALPDSLYLFQQTPEEFASCVVCSEKGGKNEADDDAGVVFSGTTMVCLQPCVFACVSLCSVHV